jgi:hypothetical protein
VDITPLDYRSPDTGGTARPAADPKAFLIICCVVAPVMVAICARVEVLNARAGGYLPRVDEGKWRSFSARAYEFGWRERRAEESDDEAWRTRPLTAAERAQLQSEIDPFMPREQLRSFVTGVALAQYPLVPVVFAAALGLLRRQRSVRHGVVAIACITFATVCGTMMFYRGYFSSMGG